jgi:hypothetical protein
MKYGRFEIKNVRHEKQKSSENECFSLDLWVDGRKAVTVWNDGFDVAHSIELHDISEADLRDLERLMAEDSFLAYDRGITRFDNAVLALLELHDFTQTVARKSKEQVVYVGNDVLCSYGKAGRRGVPTSLIDTVRREHPQAVILNGADKGTVVEVGVGVVTLDRQRREERDHSEEDEEFETAFRGLSR